MFGKSLALIDVKPIVFTRGQHLLTIHPNQSVFNLEWTPTTPLHFPQSYMFRLYDVWLKELMHALFWFLTVFVTVYPLSSYLWSAWLSVTWQLNAFSTDIHSLCVIKETTIPMALLALSLRDFSRSFIAKPDFLLFVASKKRLAGLISHIESYYLSEFNL